MVVWYSHANNAFMKGLEGNYQASIINAKSFCSRYCTNRVKSVMEKDVSLTYNIMYYMHMKG